MQIIRIRDNKGFCYKPSESSAHDAICHHRLLILSTSVSDHRLLRWALRLHRPPPVYAPSVCINWRSFDAAAFRTSLFALILCDERHWNLDGDALVNLYDLTIGDLLDQQIPVRRVTCCRRLSCVWFDDECRILKQSLRSLERNIRRAFGTLECQSVVSRGLARTAPPVRRTAGRKRSFLWIAHVNAGQSQPRRLWRSQIWSNKLESRATPKYQNFYVDAKTNNYLLTFTGFAGSCGW